MCVYVCVCVCTVCECVYVCTVCARIPCLCALCECVRVSARVAVAMLALSGDLAGSPVQAVGVWEGSRVHRHCLDGWLGCQLWLWVSVACGLSLSISNQLQAVLTRQVHRPRGVHCGLTAPALMPRSALSHPPPSLLLMDCQVQTFSGFKTGLD